MLFITGIIGLVFFGFGGYWLYSLIRPRFDQSYSPALKPWMSLTISIVAFVVSGTMANKIPDLELNKQIETEVNSIYPIITMEKYKQLQSGMSYQQVITILGKEGEELSRNDMAGYTTVMYQWSEGFGNMNAMFQNNHLVQKAQFGLK